MLNPDVVHQLFCPLPEEAFPEPPPPKGLSLRVPAQLVAYIDEMAQISGLSRNAMAIHVLDWGVQFALQNLPEDLGKRVLVAFDGHGGYVTPYPGV